jgi:hypothetical protein
MFTTLIKAKKGELKQLIYDYNNLYIDDTTFKDNLYYHLVSFYNLDKIMPKKEINNQVLDLFNLLTGE